jgi:hypothetical protein
VLGFWGELMSIEEKDVFLWTNQGRRLTEAADISDQVDAYIARFMDEESVGMGGVGVDTQEVDAGG